MNRAPLSRASLACVLLASSVLLTPSNGLLAQSTPAKPSKAAGRTEGAPLTAASLASMSDIVVVGKVGSMVSEWNSDKSAIFTRVTIDVAETVRGTLSGRTVTVVVPGGEIGDDGEWYSHTPRFTAQEEVVLFAGKAADGTYRVSGGEQGKLTVERDRETGVKVIPNVGSLQAFTGHLRSPKSTKEN